MSSAGYMSLRGWNDMRYFDTHAHLADARFDDDRDELISSVLPASGVELICEVACDLATADKSLKIIRENDYIFGAAGMHPHYADRMDNAGMELLRGLMANEKLLAIGEIGLDYHYDFSPREVQRRWFGEQLFLAEELSLPVILHIREAMGDCMDILRAHKASLLKNGGIMHCFSGSYESAKECIELGLAIGIGGSLTFKNARKLIEVAEKVPLSSVVLETDCPYMTPVPHRGERNDPTFLPFVAAKLAEIKVLPVEEIVETTFANGCRVLRVPSTAAALAE